MLGWVYPDAYFADSIAQGHEFDCGGGLSGGLDEIILEAIGQSSLESGQLRGFPPHFSSIPLVFSEVRREALAPYCMF